MINQETIFYYQIYMKTRLLMRLKCMRQKQKQKKQKPIFLFIQSQKGLIWNKPNKYYPTESGFVGHYFESSCDCQGTLRA